MHRHQVDSYKLNIRQTDASKHCMLLTVKCNAVCKMYGIIFKENANVILDDEMIELTESL